jgi:tRNA(fMet)-specific endonuclease VapC
MTYLLDTNFCIQYLNGRSENVRRRLESERSENIVLCSVVKAELLFGAVKSTRPTENLDRLRFFFRRFSSLPFDDMAAETYGEIRARLERAGRLIGSNDLLIAAIALSQGVTLVTNNTREFRRVDGLRLEDWE